MPSSPSSTGYQPTDANSRRIGGAGELQETASPYPRIEGVRHRVAILRVKEGRILEQVARDNGS